MGKNISLSKKILLEGIVAIVLGVAQYFIVMLIRWWIAQGILSGFPSEATFGICYLMIPLLACCYAFAAIVEYFFKSSRDSMAKIGLYLAIAAIPLIVFLFILNTRMGVI